VRRQRRGLGSSKEGGKAGGREGGEEEGVRDVVAGVRVEGAETEVGGEDAAVLVFALREGGEGGRDGECLIVVMNLHALLIRLRRSFSPSLPPSLPPFLLTYPKDARRLGAGEEGGQESEEEGVQELSSVLSSLLPSPLSSSQLRFPPSLLFS